MSKCMSIDCTFKLSVCRLWICVQFCIVSRFQLCHSCKGRMNLLIILEVHPSKQIRLSHFKTSFSITPVLLSNKHTQAQLKLRCSNYCKKSVQTFDPSRAKIAQPARSARNPWYIDYLLAKSQPHWSSQYQIILSKVPK